MKTLVNMGVEMAGSALDHFDDLPNALFSHGLVLFRSQHLCPDELVQIARLFGDAVANTRFWEERPEVLRISNELGPNGERTGILESDALEWHSDGSHLHGDKDGVVLYAAKTDVGTVTTWSDTAKAFQSLPEDLCQRLEDVVGVHDFFSRGNDYPMPEKQRDELRRLGPRKRSLLCRHPVNGRISLYVSPIFLAGAEGPHTDLRALIAASTDPAFCYDHQWRTGDLILFDNLTTLHKRSPVSGPRTIHRVQFGYEKRIARVLAG